MSSAVSLSAARASDGCLGSGDRCGLRIACRGLGFRRGERWLFRGMDWVVPQGRFVAVVGPSGVGKSTFLRVLAGIEKPAEGRVEYGCPGMATCGPRQIQPRIGMVFQNLRLVVNDTLVRNVMCGRLGRYSTWRTAFGFPRSDRREALEILRRVGLGPRAHAWVAETSGGEQQRAALARALFQEPGALLADEPISQLDPASAHMALSLIKDEAHRRGITVLCVLHDGAMVAKYADYVLHLEPGGEGAWRVREMKQAQEGTISTPLLEGAAVRA